MQRSLQTECIDAFDFIGNHLHEVAQLAAETTASATHQVAQVEPQTMVSHAIKGVAAVAVGAYVAYKAPLLLLLLIPAAIKAATRDRCER